MTTVALCLFFGCLSALYGIYGSLSILGLMLIAGKLIWPEGGYLVVAATLHLLTAGVCGYTCVLRLNERPASLWAVISLLLAAITVVTSLAWLPFYYFFGM